MSGSLVNAAQAPIRLPAAFAACAVMAGCALFKPGAEIGETEPAPQTPPAAVTPAEPAEGRMAAGRPSGADNLLAYYTQIRKLSGPDLAREHDFARQAFSSGRSDFNRVRLAMVVTLPNTPFFDDTRGLELLEPVWKNPDSQLSGLAILLASQIQERKRLDANAQALQQKLNALKSLERSLIERKR